MDINRPYTNELIAIIYRCQRVSDHTDDDKDDPASEPDDIAQYSPEENVKIRMHVIIYNFLALSTVLEQSRDVGAIAVYELPDTIRVYYSKNQLSNRCQTHVEKLAALVRTAAKDSQVTRKKLTYDYFTLILSNARSKFISRLQNFKDSVLRKPDFGFTTAQDLIEYLKTGAFDNVPFVCANSADTEAAAFSLTKNLYEGLSIILEKLVENVSTPSESLEYYVKMSFYCYMFGHSSLIVSIAKQQPRLIPLVEAAQKFGEYLRGVTRLFRAIAKNDATRERYSRFDVIVIPPPQPVNIRLHPDWFDVLRTVYRRRNGREITITKNQFRGVYGGIRNYEKYLRTEFVQHAEITLLTHLARSHPPTVIGLSKSCCVLCYQYVTALNSYNAKQGKNKWIVGGRHENVYNWYYPSREDSPSAFENELNVAVEGVTEWIENRIMQMIENCEYQSGTESACHLLDEGERSVPEFSPSWRF